MDLLLCIVGFLLVCAIIFLVVALIRYERYSDTTYYHYIEEEKEEGLGQLVSKFKKVRTEYEDMYKEYEDIHKEYEDTLEDIMGAPEELPKEDQQIWKTDEVKELFKKDKEGFVETMTSINPDFFKDFELVRKERPERTAQYYRDKQRKLLKESIERYDWDKEVENSIEKILDELDIFLEKNPFDTKFEMERGYIPSIKVYYKHWLEKLPNYVKERTVEGIRARGFSMDKSNLQSIAWTISWKKSSMAEMLDEMG